MSIGVQEKVKFSVKKPISLLSLLVSVSLLPAPAIAAQYGISDPPPTAANESRVTVTEWSDAASNNSNRGAVRWIDGTYESYTCRDGFTGQGCDLADSRFRHTAAQILPVCQTDSQENCVVGLSGKLGDEEIVAEFMGYAGGETMPADPKLGLYAASNVSLWRIPGLIHQGGTDTYAVNLRGMLVYDAAKKKFLTNDLDASVHAYLLAEGSGFSAPFSLNSYNAILGKNQATTTHPPNCIWSDAGKCGRDKEYSVGTEIKLTARVPSEVSGWFRGRLKDPKIDIRRFSATNNVLTISAQPVDVARFSVVTSRATVSDKVYEILRYSGGIGFGIFNGAHKQLQSIGSPASFTVLSELRNLANDTSAGLSSLWSFSTIPTEGNNRCLTDKTRVLGIVTTNATVYDGTVPDFARGVLSYQLAGMHFHADGETPVLGSYDLVMRSDVARCLYGFNKAPVSATITIAGEGDKSIATTVVGEKNGWLKLAAYGFTFSQKTIKVKLTQKRTTITCVSQSKPVKTRKVTGLSPKCPAGFIQKNT